MRKKYYTYILLTKNNTLYCGYTDDVNRRFKTHTEGKGAKYTKSNKPIKIVYQKAFNTKSEAMKEEYRIKKLTKKQKLEIISEYNKIHNHLLLLKIILVVLSFVFCLMTYYRYFS